MERETNEKHNGQTLAATISPALNTHSLFRRLPSNTNKHSPTKDTKIASTTTPTTPQTHAKEATPKLTDEEKEARKLKLLEDRRARRSFDVFAGRPPSAPAKKQQTEEKQTPTGNRIARHSV